MSINIKGNNASKQIKLHNSSDFAKEVVGILYPKQLTNNSKVDGTVLEESRNAATTVAKMLYNPLNESMRKAEFYKEKATEANNNIVLLNETLEEDKKKYNELFEKTQTLWDKLTKIKKVLGEKESNLGIEVEKNNETLLEERINVVCDTSNTNLKELANGLTSAGLEVNLNLTGENLKNEIKTKTKKFVDQIEKTNKDLENQADEIKSIKEDLKQKKQKLETLTTNIEETKKQTNEFIATLEATEAHIEGYDKLEFNVLSAGKGITAVDLTQFDFEKLG